MICSMLCVCSAVRSRGVVVVCKTVLCCISALHQSAASSGQSAAALHSAARGVLTCPGYCHHQYLLFLYTYTYT